LVTPKITSSLPLKKRNVISTDEVSSVWRLASKAKVGTPGNATTGAARQSESWALGERRPVIFDAYFFSLLNIYLSAD
jgi:hypothetical protein